MKRAGRAAVRALIALFAVPLASQTPRGVVLSSAEVAISQGRLDDAENALFAASSRSTHEPSARGALGWYLASRGRFRIGATLLEEARQFGGDPSSIDPRLAQIYAWLGDWAAIAALPSPAGSIEHDLARWMATHAPAVTGPDSVTVTLEPNEAAGLGRIALTIGRATVQADIDPTISGLVLPLTPDVAAESELIGMRDSSTLGAVRTVGIGALKLTNVRAFFGKSNRAAIGLDVLASLTPTFDAAGKTLTLRLKSVAQKGEQIPILLAFPGVRIVPRMGQPPVMLESAAGRAAVRGSRWTFDIKHGAIFMQQR